MGMDNTAIADIASNIASATASMQSSIIKPRYRDDDVRFCTMSMYDDDNVFQNISSGAHFAVPGSNTKLFSTSSYYTALWYYFLRHVLMFFFCVYEYYLAIFLFTSDVISLFSSSLWHIMSFIPFPEDVSTVGPAAILTSTSINNFEKSNFGKLSFKNRIHRCYNDYMLFPTRIGNFILRKSLSSSLPRNRLQIRQVTGTYYIPEHITFIFEMNALVIPQPPEVPTPFLDCDKNVVVPGKKEVTQVLAKRAEWASANRTHKAAESFRIIYESAKCICWAACSGVRIVTIFDSNGYAWDDMPKLCSVILQEMKNLTKESYQVYDSIKLINLSTLEVLNVYEQHKTSSEKHEFLEDDNFKKFDETEDEIYLKLNSGNLSQSPIENSKITELDPTPESIVSSTSDIELQDLNDPCHTFRTNLTVFFMSNKETDAKMFHSIRIKRELSKRLNKPEIFDIPNNETKHYPIYPGYLKEKYVDPEIIFRFCSPHQMPNSLSGYPLSIQPSGSEISPIFISQAKPANFTEFITGLTKLNSEYKRK